MVTGTLAGRVGSSVLLSLLMAAYGYKKKAVSMDGAVAGFVVGMFSCLFGGLRGFFVLFMFFVSSSKLTKFKEFIKKDIEHEHKKGGQRNIVQVAANGFVGCVCITAFALSIGDRQTWTEYLYMPEVPLDPSLYFWPGLFMVGYLAHYACCNGDTWASELGTASGSKFPLLLFGIKQGGRPIFFSRVPRGTNGGISMVGTVASILGGLFIGLSFAILDTMFNYQSISLQTFLLPCAFGTFAGFTGSMVSNTSIGLCTHYMHKIDSFLGGTLQNSFINKSGKIMEHKDSSQDCKHITGIGILDNHQVRTQQP